MLPYIGIHHIYALPVINLTHLKSGFMQQGCVDVKTPVQDNELGLCLVWTLSHVWIIDLRLLS